MISCFIYAVIDKVSRRCYLLQWVIRKTSYNMVNRKGKKIGIVNKTKVSIKQKLYLLPIIQSIHIINSNIGNTAQNGCLKL